MSTKTLNEKIKDVIFWMLIFFSLYLIVGYLIQSEYLHCALNWDASYNLLRDALTITAYFLAPTAAFMLFSDWREQHAVLATEADSTNVYKSVNELIDKLYEIHYFIEENDCSDVKSATVVSNLMLEVSNTIGSLGIINSQVGSRSNKGEIFAECAKKIFEEIIQINLNLSHLCSCKTKIQNPEKFNNYIDTTSTEYSEHIQAQYEGLNYQITRSYPKLNVLKNELSGLCDGLRIKH